MPIKPIDMQVIIPKSLEVAKINNDDNHKSSALQYQQAITMQHKVDDNLRQVYHKDKIHETAIREKQEKREGSGKRGEKEEGSNKQKKNKDIDAVKGSSIDIKI